MAMRFIQYLPSHGRTTRRSNSTCFLEQSQVGRFELFQIIRPISGLTFECVMAPSRLVTPMSHSADALHKLTQTVEIPDIAGQHAGTDQTPPADRQGRHWA